MRGSYKSFKEMNPMVLGKYIMILFLRDRDLVTSFFRLGLSMGFLELEFVGQISSFERRLRGRLQHPSPCLIRSLP